MHNFDTLFLDRDGVINKKLDGKYVRNFSEFQFLQGALKAVSDLSDIFNRIIVITNQQGVAKGIMSEADLNLLHSQMVKQIENVGGKIDKIYYCPHLAESNCICRKPKPGMIQQAIKDFPDIIIEDSFLVGDSQSDIDAGISMRLNTVKVDSHKTLAKWCAEISADS